MGRSGEVNNKSMKNLHNEIVTLFTPLKIVI